MPSEIIVAARKRAAVRKRMRGWAPLPEVHENVIKAFDAVGGDLYLAEIAYSHPSAFLSLLAKVMPLEEAIKAMAAEVAAAKGPQKFEKIERVIVRPETSDAGSI